MHSVIQTYRLKSTLYETLKDKKLIKKLKITPTCFESYVIHHHGVYRFVLD